MSNSLFIIYTPYQLISAANTIDTLQLKNVDCLIMQPNILRYEDGIRTIIDGDIFCFPELFDVTPNSNWLVNHVHVFLNLLKKKRYFNSHPFEKEYSDLFVPSDDTSCRVIYYELKKRYNITLNLFDDGVSTYSGLVFKEKRLVSRIIYALLSMPKLYENVAAIYCYHPQLVNNIKHLPVIQIVYKQHTELFNPYVQEFIPFYKGKSAIFLDQGYPEKGIIQDALAILGNLLGKENVLIKMHPRISGDNHYLGYQTVHDGLPFEAIVSALDCSHCLLVSHSSTGCITPILLKGESPLVIMLNSIYDNKQDMQNIEFFKSINEMMSEECIYMPESVSDIRSFVTCNMERIKGAQ